MHVEVATPADDTELRQLLRDTPIRGEITLSFEREPDYFRAASEGSAGTYTVVVRDPKSRRIACFGDVGLRHVFLNGQSVRAAYLSSWRVGSDWRGRPELLEAGLDFISSLQQERLSAEVFYSAIVADNTAARRRLETRRSGLASFHPVDDLVTYLVRTRPMRKPNSAIAFADQRDAAELRRFLKDRLCRFQFASDWTAPELSDEAAPVGSAFLSLHRDGAIAACAAVWDQRANRQVVVQRYSRRLRILRSAHNATARFTGKPALPGMGRPLALAAVAGLAVADDDPEVAVALLDALRCSGVREQGIGILALTLSARHPASAAVSRRLHPWTYRSKLYHVAMPGTAPPCAVSSDRPSQPEAALL